MGFVAGVWLRLGKFPYFAQAGINAISLIAVLSVTLLLLAWRETFINTTGIAVDYTNGLIAPLFINLIVLLAINTSHCMTSSVINGWYYWVKRVFRSYPAKTTARHL